MKSNFRSDEGLIKSRVRRETGKVKSSFRRKDSKASQVSCLKGGRYWKTHQEVVFKGRVGGLLKSHVRRYSGSQE